MANLLKSIFLFVVSTIGFSICFTTVLQFALWLYRSGCSVTVMTTKTAEPERDAIDSENIQKSIILHNLLLILLFVVQHSLMATNIFKRFLGILGLEVVQRSIYVIATCVVLQVLMYFWLPLYPDHPVWALDHRYKVLWFIFTVVHVLAWLIMFGVVLVIDYPELIGVKQVYYFLINSPPPMQMKSLSNKRMFDNYRHPILTSLLIVLWFVPVMTLDRLLLAIFLTVYTCLGHRLDAQDYGYLESQLQHKLAHLQTVQYSYWYD